MYSVLYIPNPTIPTATVQSLINERRAAADRAIAPLQDAVDLSMATEQETALLTEWRRYRVLLNRVDISKAPDINWPEQPN